MQNSNRYGRGPGASIYLTQEEMDVVLEALEMLRTDTPAELYSPQFRLTAEFIEEKILKKYKP